SDHGGTRPGTDPGRAGGTDRFAERPERGRTERQDKLVPPALADHGGDTTGGGGNEGALGEPRDLWERPSADMPTADGADAGNADTRDVESGKPEVVPPVDHPVEHGLELVADEVPHPSCGVLQLGGELSE